MPKQEQISRWASQEAAIKTEINEAKDTLDLMRMATATSRLDALHAEMEAAASLTPRKSVADSRHDWDGYGSN